MLKIKVKNLKNLLENLDENKEVLIVTNYFSGEPKVELIKEVNPKGSEYYKIIF